MPPATFEDVTLDREQRIGAMLSVRAHVRLDEKQLRALKLMPLERATHILSKDEGDYAVSRRRRATALLLAARAAREAPVRGNRLRQVEQALAKLGMNAAHLETLDAEFRLLFPLGSDAKIRNVLWLDYIYANMIARLFPALYALNEGRCTYRKEAPGPSVTPIGQWPVVLRTKVSVNIPVDDVALHIDPQQWDECSAFWDPPPDATRLMDWRQGHAVPKSNPPAAGSAYPTQLLMQERFQCGTFCGDADFDLLLCVATRCLPTSTGSQCSTRDQYTSAYNLPLGLAGSCTCTSGTCPVPCGKTNTKWWLTTAKIGGATVVPCIDEGTVHARRDPSDPNRTIVEADKTLHFDPGHYTTSVAFLWTLLLEEMNDELGDLACCRKKNP